MKDVYPKLYLASRLKGVLVATIGGWREGSWIWSDFGIFMAMLEELGLSEGLIRFRDRLAAFGGTVEGRDSVSWNFDSQVVFSVASCYVYFGKFSSRWTSKQV